MPKRLTQSQFEEIVDRASNGVYSVESKYQAKRKVVIIRCNKHNVLFECKAECFMRGKGDIRSTCPSCLKEKRTKKYESARDHFVCAYCGKDFIRPHSYSINSKSGLYFCCREHKDAAQSIDSNCVAIRPNHYKNGEASYRDRAFRNYDHVCSACGWDEDSDILEVHHIDEDRGNNDLSNLIILCPICHRKVSSHKYKLVNRNSIARL